MTRSQTRPNTALTVFYEYAYYSAITESITADLSTVKEALATKDADKWRKVVKIKYKNHKRNST